MSTMTKPTGSASWVLEHSKTLTGKSQSVTITLSTANTYVDKDIKIVETVTAQDATVTVSAAGGSVTPVVAVVAGSTNASTGTVTTAKPASGHYIAVNTGATSGTATATMNVSKAGWVATGTTTAAATVTVNAATTKYVPINAGSVTTTMTSSGLDTYFQAGTSTDKDITITPQYKAGEGYIDAVSTATNNGGTTYWKIKQGTISTATASQLTSTYSGYTANTTAVVPAEGGLIIGAGYYPNTKITLATLIPDDGNYTNAGTGNILKGYEAYNTDGKKLIGTIESMSLSSDYYTTTVSLGQSGSAVTGSQYNAGSTQYIKTGAVSASADGTSIKPVISADTTAISGKTNVNGTVTTTQSSVSSPYYVAVKTAAKTGTVTAHANVTTAGWLAAGDHTATATVSASASDVAYMNIAAGKVSASGGSVTVTASNVISTSMTTTTTSTNAYAINATATSNGSRGAVTLSAGTSGYVSGKSGELTGLGASGTTTVTTAADTIYIPKATVSITSKVGTAPSVTTNVSTAGICTSASATSYAVTVTNSATNGSITPSYTATAGYTEGYSTAQNGTALAVTPSKTATQTVYIQAGAVSSSVDASGMSTYFNSGTSTSKDVTLTPSASVDTEGYVKSASAGTASYYKIKTTSLSGSNVSNASVTAGTKTNTISGTNITLYDSKETGKEYATISDSVSIPVTTSGTATVNVGGTAGWVASNASKSVTVSGSGTVTSSAEKYVLIYGGDYSVS